MSGTFITFEGVDGSGKSTQLEMLAKELRHRGVKVLTTREPGGTPLGLRLRDSLLDINEPVDPLAELLIFAADRAQHVRTVIRPALAHGKTVLSDRYADATVAYQGAGRGFPTDTIQRVIELATDGLKPDLTLFFDLSVQESIRRTSDRHLDKQADRIDIESVEFHERVRNGYLAIAALDPHRFRVIDASGPAADIHHRVLRELEK